VCGGEDGIWQVTSVRDVMHAEIEPQDQIFLLQALAVEELVEINEWIVDTVQG